MGDKIVCQKCNQRVPEKGYGLHMYFMHNPKVSPSQVDRRDLERWAGEIQAELCRRINEDPDIQLSRPKGVDL